MGEMSDYALEQAENDMIELWDYRAGRMSQSEAYDRGIIDEMGYEHSPTTAFKTCRNCNAGFLVWKQVTVDDGTQRWRLAEATTQELHVCHKRADTQAAIPTQAKEVFRHRGSDSTFRVNAVGDGGDVRVEIVSNNTLLTTYLTREQYALMVMALVSYSVTGKTYDDF